MLYLKASCNLILVLGLGTLLLPFVLAALLLLLISFTGTYAYGKLFLN